MGAPFLCHPPVRVAAVQIEGRVGDLAYNLQQAEALAVEALARGAKIVALPEFFTTPCYVHPRIHEAIVGFDNHKDQPTMWENGYYIAGTDDGVVETEYGTAGLAVCWELVRWRTIKRFAGRVRLAITGNQWWTVAENWVGADTVFASFQQYNRYLSENAANEFARVLGVPILHASHCGRFEGRCLLAPGLDASVRYVSEFVGRTQIVDAAGHTVAGRDAAEGPGVVVGEIEIGGRALPVPHTGQFWIPNLTLTHLGNWYHQNACGRSYYQRRRRADCSRISNR